MISSRAVPIDESFILWKMVNVMKARWSGLVTSMKILKAHTYTHVFHKAA